jgi:phosphoribosylaminoimidazole-succinocarboxamide synthase
MAFELISVQARDYAAERGIIIADTKFEFGLDVDTDEVILVDEVLTPDSSRFWPADKYELGKSQDSFDKVRLRINAWDGRSLTKWNSNTCVTG